MFRMPTEANLHIRIDDELVCVCVEHQFVDLMLSPYTQGR